MLDVIFRFCLTCAATGQVRCSNRSCHVCLFTLSWVYSFMSLLFCWIPILLQYLNARKSRCTIDKRKEKVEARCWSELRNRLSDAWSRLYTTGVVRNFDYEGPKLEKILWCYFGDVMVFQWRHNYFLSSISS